MTQKYQYILAAFFIIIGLVLDFRFLMNPPISADEQVQTEYGEKVQFVIVFPLLLALLCLHDDFEAFIDGSRQLIVTRLTRERNRG